MILAATPQDIGLALAIFFLRTADMTLDTLRVLLVVRGRKRLAWGVGFVEALFFLAATAFTLAHLNHLVEVLGFAAGYASGVVLGMYLEDRLGVGFTRFTIVSQQLGAAISEHLRTDGFAVTELSARGRDGMVSVLHCDVRRKERDEVETIILETDPQAFVTVSDVRPVRSGFWR